MVLTRFMVIVSIAVSLDDLVFVFDAAKKDVTTPIYPVSFLSAAFYSEDMAVFAATPGCCRHEQGSSLTGRHYANCFRLARKTNKR